jgi:hypothetical protein
VSIVRTAPFTKSRYFKVAVVVGLLGVPLLLMPIEVYQDKSYVCANTGSRKSNLEWRWGKTFNHSSTKSPIEQFMRRQHPEQWSNRWVKVRREVKNVFRMKLGHRHGRAPANYSMRLLLEHEKGARFFAIQPPERLRAIYMTFSPGSDEEVKVLVEQLYEEWFDLRERDP